MPLHRGGSARTADCASRAFDAFFFTLILIQLFEIQSSDIAHRVTASTYLRLLKRYSKVAFMASGVEGVIGPNLRVARTVQEREHCCYPVVGIWSIWSTTPNGVSYRPISVGSGKGRLLPMGIYKYVTLA